MNDFRESLKDAAEIFSGVFEKDTVGPQIEAAAKNDNDFKVWLLKNRINYSSFSQSDWINQYAQWAK
jgi:hypothetical protein